MSQPRVCATLSGALPDQNSTPEAHLSTPHLLSRFRDIVVRIHDSDRVRRFFPAHRYRDQTEENARHLYAEVLWAGVFFAATSFNAAYAVRLGASNRMIGWLSAIPSLLVVLLRIPSARFLETKSNRAQWLWGSLFVYRLGYIAIALLPWLTVTHRAAALIWIVIVTDTIYRSFFFAGFTPLLADLIPKRDRARIFAYRSICFNGSLALFTFIAGQWLDLAPQVYWAAFPANYQVLYAIGFVGSLLSVVALLRVKVPPREPAVPTPRLKTEKRSIPPVKVLLTEHRDFIQITLNTVIFGLGEWMAAPLYIIFFVRELNASDGWIGLRTTMASIGVTVGYALWRRWMRKLGYGRTLLISHPLAAIYAILVGLFPNLTAILIWGALTNIANAGVFLSRRNVVLDLCPDERREVFWSIHGVAINFGAFVGPLLGVALAEIMPIRWVILLAGGIRLLGAALFHIFRINVQEVDIR